MAPSFDLTNTTLPGSLEVTVGITLKLQLPPIIDPEGDNVEVSVKLDGQQVSSCIANCHVEYDAKEGVISIEYPLFYFIN